MYELSQVGYHEDPHGHTKFGAWYAPGFAGAQWCCMFQSYSHWREGNVSPFPASGPHGAASCYALQQWAMKHGMYVPGSEMPKRHDLAFYKWPGDAIVHHIAKVITPLGIRHIKTVGGNEGNAVRIAERNTSSIVGYLRLPIVDGPKPPAPKPKPPTEEEDVTTKIVQVIESGSLWVMNAVGRRNVTEADARKLALAKLAVYDKGGKPFQWKRAVVELVPRTDA